MIERILYFCLLIPFSYLPLSIIYLFSSFLNFILINIFTYRKDIASKNIDLAFANISQAEKKALLKSFYMHLCDILGEGIKNMSISKKQLQKKMVIENAELFNQYYKENKSLILMSSHCNNWEYLISILNIAMPHQAVGIGKPLSKKFLDQKLNSRRERFGIKVIHAKNYKTEIPLLLKGPKPIVVLVLADQSPTIDKAFWTTFLGKDTSFSFGGELLAHQYNMPVVYLKTIKTTRGVYRVIPQVISNQPQEESYGKITTEYVALLEKNILDQPANWLWTHRRWKHGVPDNLPEIKKNHKELFEVRFNKKSD